MVGQAGCCGFCRPWPESSRKPARPSIPVACPRTGTTLVRQWRGHAHTVLVRDDGFEYQGERYRSLSMIAERITGAHWSGPRFFGLSQHGRFSGGVEAGR
jgi:DUF2924 family protein